MNKDFVIFKSLISVLVRNSFRIEKVKRTDRKKGNPVNNAKLSMLIGAFVFGLLGAMMATVITATAIPLGLQEEVLYTLIAMSQVVVLFFGAIAVMGYLYFSNDNNLLASLPVKPHIVFSAKFCMAYLSELMFSAIITLPMLTAYGIVCMVSGTGIAWHYFVFMLFTIPLLPILPLFLITLISMPLMYLVSFFRKRTLGNSIALGIIYLLAMAVYFLFIFGFQSLTVTEGDTTTISPAAVALFRNIKKISIYNYNIVSALSNSNAIINFFIYLIANIGILAMIVALSAFFYRKTIAVIIEGAAGGSSASKKKEKAEIAVKTSVYRSFFLKEVRTLINTPALLISTILSLLLPPMLMLFLSFTMGNAMSSEESGMNGEMFMTGYATFLSYMLISSTNMVATIGISREGKNLYILKTLPIPVKMIIKCKLFFAGMITLACTVIMGITYPIVFGITNPFAIIMFPVVVLVGALGVNALALYSDLKRPKLDWSNISQLTSNNKNTLKFLLPVMLVGFAYMIIAVILAIQTTIKGGWEYVLFYAVAAIPAVILLTISMTKLFKNPEELFERIGN